MVEAESRIFKIAVFVVTTIIAGYSLAAIIYFAELRSGKVISQGELTSMMIISIIIFVITILLWLWAMYRLFIHKDIRDQLSQQARAKVSSIAYSTQGGITPQQVQKVQTRYVRAKQVFRPVDVSSETIATPLQEELSADV